jgi:hypothetical protein
MRKKEDMTTEKGVTYNPGGGRGLGGVGGYREASF